MSSASGGKISIPVRFACTRGNETTYALQYIEVPAYSTMDDVRALARERLREMLAGQRNNFSSSLPASGGLPLVCGFEILPILAIPR